jgi:spore maturation protein A
MNAIWLLILISSVTTLLFVNPDGALTAMISGSQNAVNLALTLVASYGFWLGFFKLLEKTGINKIVTKLLRPLIRFLFKDAGEAESLISMNMSANLLGLGNASTPVGISAMKILEKDDDKPNENMIMLAVISATSLQLIPSTVIGMRISHGSISPTSFLIPCIIATVSSTVIGITLVKVISLVKRKIKTRKSVKLQRVKSVKNL